MRVGRPELIAIALVVWVGCNARGPNGSNPTASDGFVGHWRSTEVGAADSGVPSDAFTYTFRADGTFDLSGAVADRIEEFSGTFEVCDGEVLKLTIPGKGTYVMRYLLRGVVLTIRDEEDGSYVRLEKTSAAAPSVRTGPTPPNAEQVVNWAAFTRPLRLERNKLSSGVFFEWGEPVWVYAYAAPSETLASYIVGLYKAGALFGEHRAATESFVETQPESRNGCRVEDPAQRDTGMPGLGWVETRRDGRKVYFTALGFGPGGHGVCAFTTLLGYDLMLYHLTASEHGAPQDRIKDPAQPTNGLPEIFKSLEGHLAGQE